jgi:hypothetical protein
MSFEFIVLIVFLVVDAIIFLEWFFNTKIK